MHPSRPTSTDPNAAYRAAIAALADNRPLEEYAVNPAQAENAHHQQNPLAALNRRRSAHADCLNRIAHTLGPGVRLVMELMAAENTAAPNTTNAAPHVAEPGRMHGPSGNTALHREAAIRTIRQLINATGMPHRTQLSDNVILNRLASANLRPDTFIAAMQIAQTPDHPTLISLNASALERNDILCFLVDVMNYRHGFNQMTRDAGHAANNNPNDLIAAILLGMR